MSVDGVGALGWARAMRQLEPFIRCVPGHVTPVSTEAETVLFTLTYIPIYIYSRKQAKQLQC